MVAVVAGTGLGLERSSGFVLGSAGQLGQALVGRGGDNVYVNASTGNLVVQNTDEMLFGLGADSVFDRTYNAQAASGNWHRSATRRITGLDGTPNTAGSTVKRISWDGSDVTYTYDAALGAYVAREGEGGYDRLSLAGQTWTWTDGASRTVELYDNANGGRITSSRDADGNGLTYTYNASGQLTRVTTQDGGYTALVWTNGNLVRYETHYLDGGVDKTLTRVRYGYDASNRLTSVTVDLSPADNSVSDGNTYVTTYGYDASNRLTSITQGANTSDPNAARVSFTYVQVGGASRVATVVQRAANGVTRTTSFSYDIVARVTTVTDPLGLQTALAYDPTGRLTSVTAPAATAGAPRQVTTFAYNNMGDVTEILSADGTKVAYTYDPNGNRLSQVDDAGVTTRWTYGSRNEALTETRYITAGQGGAAASDPVTTRYAYDSENHLRFVVSAEGEATEYLYDTLGNRVAEIQYLGASYNISGLAENQSIAESSLSSWVSGIDRSQAKRTDTAYDFRGNVASVTSYSRVLSTGLGDTAAALSRTVYVYDQFGKLLSRQPVGVAQAEVNAYDGLGRLVATTDFAGRTTSVQFNDTASTTVVTLANGLTRTSTYNLAGELLSVAEAGAGVATATTSYRYDAGGRLRVVIDATDRRTHSLYDAAGRQVAQVGSDGAVTEFKYDADNLLIATVEYARKLTGSQLASLTDASGNPQNVTLDSLRPAGDEADRWEWRIYDAANRLIETIDPVGAATVYSYDGASRLVSTVRYAQLFDASSLALFRSTPPTTLQSPGNPPAAPPASPPPYSPPPNTAPVSTNDTATTSQGSAVTFNPRANDSDADNDGLLITAVGSAANGTVTINNGYTVTYTPNAAFRGTDSFTYTVSDGRGGASTSTVSVGVYAPNEYTALTAAGVSTWYDGDTGLDYNATVDNNYLGQGYKALILQKSPLATARPTYTGTETRPGSVSVMDAGAAGGEVWTVNPGERLGVAFEAKGLGASTHVTLSMYFWDADWANVGDSASVTVPISEWNRVETVITAPANARYAAVIIEPTAAGDQRTASSFGLAIRKTQFVRLAAGQAMQPWPQGAPANAAPIAGADVVSTTQGAALTFNPRVNDTDADKDPLSVVSVSTPAHGAAVANADGTITYTPQAGYTGSDSFSYTVSDGRGGTATATVSVTVSAGAGNSNPMATNNAASTPKDTPLTFNPASDDSDPNGDPISITAVTTPAHGTAILNANGTVTYTPAAGYTGPDSFSYTISDGQGGTATATVSLTVTAPAGADDRVQRNFYDRNGRLVGTLDAEGFLTETRYDRGGQKLETIAYANVTDESLRANGAFAALKSSAGVSVTDVHNWFLYDGRGLLMAAIDGEGNLTRYQYTALGEPELVTVGQKLDPASLIATPPTLANLPTAPAGAVLETTLYNRDALGLVLSEVRTLTGGATETTSYSYDNMRRLVSSTKAAGTADTRTLNQTYDARGRLTGALNGEGSAVLAALGATPTPAQVADVYGRYGVTYAYDNADRMIAKTEANGVDAIGNRTLYYYDTGGRLTYEINALGEVRQYAYNTFGERTDTIAYGTRVASATLAGLTGGAITPAVTAAITANAALDSTTRLDFDRLGLVSARTDALGAITRYQYNAFGELAAQIEPIETGVTVETRRTYDRRGLVLTEIKDAAAGGLQLTTAFGYDAFGRAVQTTDAVGKVRTAGYDRAGRVLTQTDALGQQTSFTYDGRGLVLTKTDRNGETTAYAYTAFGREVRVTTPEGLLTITRTNAHGQTIAIVDGAGRTTTWTYDRNGNVRFVTNGSGGTTESQYDEAGRLKFTIDGAQRQTRYAYDAAGRVLTRTVDPDTLNLVTTYEYDAKGQQVKVTDPRGSVTLVDYDLNGREARVTVDALGAALVTTYAYDQRGRLLTLTEGFGSPAQTVTAHRYDKADQLESTTVDPSGLNLVTRYAYDGDGNPVAKTDAEGAITRYVYDGENRQIATVDGAGAVTHYAYDAEGRMTSARRYANVMTGAALSSLPLGITLAQAMVADSTNDQVTSYVYDRDGRLAFVVDPNGRLTGYAYDGAGAVTAVTEYAGAIATAVTYSLSYVLSEIASKNLNASSANRTTRLIYDEAGRRAFSIDATGLLTAYSYDGSGAVTKTVRHGDRYTATNVSLSTLRSWSNARLGNARTNRIFYDGAGRAVYDIDAENYVSARTYDAGGNVTEERRYGARVTVGDATTRAQLSTQLAGQSVPVRTLQYAYDGAGRLTDTYDGVGVRTRLILDSRGRVTERILAYGTADQASTEYAYDAAGRLRRETRAFGSAEATTTTYTYDGLGRLESITDGLGYTTTRSYDAAGRMTSEVKPRNDAAPTATTTYTYDAFGNVTAITDPRGYTGYFYYDKLNRQVMQVDPEGYVTSTTYTIGGEVQSVTRRYNRGTGYGPATPPTVTAHAKDATTTFTRDKLDRITAIQDAQGFTESFQLNAFGDQLTYTNKVGGQFVRTFDGRGLMLTERAPETTSAGAIVINAFEYDARGNLTRKVEAQGLTEQRTTRYIYDLADRVVETLGDTFGALAVDFTTPVTVNPRTVNRYDARSNLIEVHVTETGARTLFYYDDLNRKIAQVDAMGGLTTYGYDANGNVVQFRAYDDRIALPPDPGGPPPANGGGYRLTTYQYDRANRLVAATVAGLRTAEWTGSTFSTQIQDVTTRLEYDATGNVVREVDGRGDSVWSYYDRRGKKIAQVDQGGYLTSYTLDSEGNVLKEERFATKLASAVGAGSDPESLRIAVQGDATDRITEYTYDRNGRRLTETRKNVNAWVISSSGSINAGPQHATVGFQYDGLGNITRKTEATGEAKNYTYDKLGRLTEERGVGFYNYQGNQRTPVQRHAYDGLGNVVQTFQGAIEGALGESDRITNYTYGTGGRLVSVRDAEGFVRNFGYDAAGRLSLVSYDRLNASAIGASSINTGDVTREGTGYQYDLLGRQKVEAQVYWASNRWNWAEPIAKQYDAHGGVIGHGTASNLTGSWVFPEQNAYDAGGRIWRTTGGDGTVRLFLYDANGNRTLTISSVGADISSWTLDQAIAILTNNGQSAIGAHYVEGVVVTIEVYDHRGQVVEQREPLRQLGQAGTLSTVRHTRTYTAFGEIESETNALGGVTQYTYTTDGKIRSSRDVGKQYLDANGQTGSSPQWTYFHDASGRLVAEMNSRGHTTSWQYLGGTGYDGSAGRVTVQFNPDGSKQQSFYNVFQNKRFFIDELGPIEPDYNYRNRVMEYGYDNMGRMIWLVQPQRGNGE
ncbi:Ig-like domain-containing protein, partial [Mycolicibacterium sp.]|uniref:Ig-like domain-containing protein n=1 Tax=Mycolicibacterium sp. TaxID=2320850 RepID=UPI00355FCBF8